MHRHNHNHSQGGVGPPNRGRPVIPEEGALASECFEQFLTASTLKTILGYYRNICEYLHLKPNVLPLFYPKLKAHINSWKAKPLWKKFDTRANQKCYGRGKACPHTRVLVIGGGPCGLRTAIEAQLLGAKVVVVEKRDRMSRNNVLHLWPFVIDDLRALGAKKFFGKFCAGAIDHISIRQLQCILLKVALLLGVEVHTEVSFERILEPNLNEKTGWRAEFKPSDHPVSQFEFDVIIGADGKRNTLQGFKRKEFRGKLAIAITANFINKRTEAEARVEEISGVAFIFNQKFFKDLYAETGIDLENIVYYKDDTHYFVMTAKKQSLIDKGVIREDLSDTAKLLAPDNVDREELMNYAREAAEFSTNYQMPCLEFAVNHYGQPDVAMFDFTSMYAAENASRVTERHNYKLMSILVGDSLLEPFWPTGSGCARGFLSSMDAAWAIRSWGSDTATPLEVIAERESIYRLLAQTTPENLNKDYKSYTIDPSTRYPNLNRNALLPHQVTALYDSDEPKSIELNPRPAPAMTTIEVPKKRRRRESHVDADTLLSWIREQIREHEDLEVANLGSSFRDGRILCAIISHYRPDLLDYSAINAHDHSRNNQVAFDLLEKELGIPPIMTGEEMANGDSIDYLTILSYLTKVYDTFRCEIPHIKYPKWDMPEIKRNEQVLKVRSVNVPDSAEAFTAATAPPSRPSSRHKRHVDTTFLNKPSAATLSQDRKARKRKTLEKVGASVEDRQKRLEEIVSNRTDRHNKRRQHRKMQTEQFIKSMQMLHANCKPDHSEPFEDYSIYLYRQTAPNFEDRVKNLERQFVYMPDKEARPATSAQAKRETDEDFAARIKGLEEKWREPVEAVEKKPKDLLRAIGKIETSDWNIKEIEKKMIENKLGKAVNKDKEKVPKWSREQFLARQTKMERQHLDRQNSGEVKFAEIDKNIKQLELKLKEGTARDLNQQKVATITEKLVGKTGESTATVQPAPQPVVIKPVQKSNSRTVIPIQGSEYCHFCSKRVYLVERLTAEGKVFHTGCFRCQYCHTSLRLGTYTFDREGLYGHRFYCAQHFGMPGEISRPEKKVAQEVQEAPQQKKVAANVLGVDLLDRVQTPERIEFSNLSTGHVSSDHEESLSPIDEDEWTDRNNINSVNDSDSSDDTSSASDTDTDDEAYEEALEEPITKEGTLRWAKRYKERYSSHKDDDSNSDGYSSSDHYYENSSEDEESDTATEGEEEIRARELRKQEVRVEPPIDAGGTDTEVASCDTSSESSSEILNSATEISTDSEFAHDDRTPTGEAPPPSARKIFDGYVTKTRGTYGHHHQRHHHQQHQQQQPKKVQVKSSLLQQPVKGGGATARKGGSSRDIELKFTPLVATTPIVRKPVAPSSLLLSSSARFAEGYALNRTQSTGGIATKVSLELKKKYLLGETKAMGGIQKSGSASTLVDSKFKSFHTNISDCQKLLRPAPEVSASMQAFCTKLSERTSPLSPTFGTSAISLYAKEKSSPNLATDGAASDVPEITETPKVVDETEGRPRSPVHERQIIEPVIDGSKEKEDVDSLSSESSDYSKHKHLLRMRSSPVHIDRYKGLFKRTKSIYSLSSESSDFGTRREYQYQARRRANESPVTSDEEVQAKIFAHYISKGNERTSPLSVLEIALMKAEVHEKWKVENETQFRPRSPVHERQIIVPVIDWTKAKAESKKKRNDFTDSLSSEPADSDEERAIRKRTPTTINVIPRVEIYDDSGAQILQEEAFDSLDIAPTNQVSPPKLIAGEKKTLNQPKTLPGMSGDAALPEYHSALHAKHAKDDFDSKSQKDSTDGRSSPSLNEDLATTAALTETELDDFEDVEYELISDIQDEIKKEPGQSVNTKANASVEIVECVNVMSLSNLENIEFMDTGTEDTSSDEKHMAVKNNGYVQFRNEEDFPEDSLSPTLDVVETVNPILDKLKSANDDPKRDTNEASTTTEENTCSDSTIKNITERITDIQVLEENKPAVVDKVEDSPEFQEHCQRLQSKIEFGNVKDSLDIKRTRRKSKPDIAVKPDLIQEEDKAVAKPTPKLSKKEEIELERNLNQKLVQEMVMTKMRAQNKSLERKKRVRNSFSPIRPFELSKSATSSDIPIPKSPELHSPTPDVLLSTIPTSPLQKCQSCVLTPIEKSFEETKVDLPDVSKTNEVFVTPRNPRIESEEAKRTVEKIKQDARARCKLLSDEELGLSPEDNTLIKMRQKVAASKKNREVQSQTPLDVHVQDSIESLVINTDRRNHLFYSNDTLKRNTSFRRSKSGDDSKFTAMKLPPTRTKSVTEISRALSTVDTPNEDADYAKFNFCKSDPNLISASGDKKPATQKKHKDRERRKSITKLIAELFSKKKETSPGGGNVGATTRGGFLSRISPKSKSKSKSWYDLDLGKIEKIEDSTLRRNSISEINLRRDIDGSVSPPPVPPLPTNYVRRNSLRDESSEAENDCKQELGSTEVLDQSEAHTSLSNGRRMSRSSRQTARQAQLKRHRMAQEIQRKLEEIEVRTRELEARGVQVEKALRGETNGGLTVDERREESDLLKEWFDLMRDRTELRRYEKELTVRAQEVELEDRHARLQHDLRERLENKEPKTKEEMEIEANIIKEMMEIVAKRDILINLLEEDRLRYFEEDRDFEEQILAKGIHLTPLVKLVGDSNN